MSEVILAALKQTGARSVLDFGCGEGRLVELLVQHGFAAFGCDIGCDWPHDDGAWARRVPAEEWSPGSRLLPIQAAPYKLPFPDETFDAVVSTSVFEHVQNKAEAFSEISRVLKPGGHAFHLLPSKWYLPAEPHIQVPFVSWMWPNVPKWWLAVWAMLGIRNEFQRGMNWRKVARTNHDYVRNGISYWSLKSYEELAPGKVSAWADLYVATATGQAAALARRLKLPPALISTFRELLLVVEK